MTIREKIITNEIAAQSERLTKLSEMGAPAVMITGTEKIIADLKSGNLKVGGDVELLDQEYVSGEPKKGNGGKTYIQINGNINYFPNTRYGRYIKMATV